jgi:hypothetical protein
MNEHEILQSFKHNSDSTWTPPKVVAIQGVNMQSGIAFSRGLPHSGIDVAAYLDDLAERYPLSVRN